MTGGIDALQERFIRDVRSSYDRATVWVNTALTDDPEAVKQKVARTLSALKGAGARLERAKALLPSQPKNKAQAEQVVRYADLKTMYDAILGGIGLNAVDLAAEPEIEAGFIPATVVLTIGALGLTAAGVAWAVANYEHAAALRDQTAFLVRELEARTEAMRTGKDLPQGSGGGDKPTGDADKGGAGWLWALLGLGAAGALVFGPKLLKKVR